ncbi:MAG: (2Fe-2S)-binding protein, partial [Candidatus Omnitrophica bacterium]|nr:(2Fe-2S)-binding protein [Candidatus Omnitrophota bacterium]
MSQSTPADSKPGSLSRRTFLKSIGTSAAATAAARIETVAQELEKVNAERVYGPSAVPITLQVNGRDLKLTVEPRVTLLEALRGHSSFIGSKEVCDRGTCGGCTVLLDGRPAYSCMKLAIDAQGQAVTTIEGLAQGTKLTPVQLAFIEKDAMMCGYCTPGFVMSVTALLEKNPHPTLEEIRHACAGNLCRCGTYPRVVEAALKAQGGDT